MQIVFAHYHLNPGGVTQVIINQIAALATLPEGNRPSRFGVLYGGRDEGWPDQRWLGISSPEVVLLPVADLDYDAPEARVNELLAERVLETLAKHGFSAQDTLLHIHNHALGKNVSWPPALRSLVEHGYRQLLQIHDFAEDSRPANYLRLIQALPSEDPQQLIDQLYPQSSSIHYATLTNKDAEVLHRAGVQDKQLRVLPNPISEFTDLPAYSEAAPKVRQELGIPPDSKLGLYPVRGIRRKNLGELLLYSAISTGDTWHAVTLAPRNPVELASFNRWRELSQELRFRALFDVCGLEKVSFLDTLAASNWLLTTSVAEGFGMVFLESWLAGKQLLGRRIPGVIDDFEAAGVKFDHLRKFFYVPLAWISEPKQLALALERAYIWACDNYNVVPDLEQLTFARRWGLGEQLQIDFALLPGQFQQQVLRRVAADPDKGRTELEVLNPGITSAGPDGTDENSIISANAAIVRSAYSLPTLGRLLYDTYETIIGCPLGGNQALSNGRAILDSFLKSEQLHAIRFEE